MKGILTALVALFLFAGHAFTQNYLIGGPPVTDCKGTFFDAGGGSANYGNNQNFTTTICSNTNGGTHIRLDFSGADIAPGDALCFFDGTNISAPMLSCSNDYAPGEPFTVQATAANPSGCLTVTFNSNASGTGAGWNAAISCVPSCQTVLGQLTDTDPDIAPVTDGWIDVCPGERVFFTGRGVYPQNGLAYVQSDLTTKFEWNFGDGTVSYGPDVSHTFDKSGGFFVQLTLTDTRGCKSLNRISQRVRVAPKPVFAVGQSFDNAICAGDTLQLNAQVNTPGGAANLSVLPKTQAFELEGSRSDSLPLPDGTGAAYQTSLYLTEFSPGQTLTAPTDLEQICVNMEHSWMRDLEISIACPGGKTAVLHDFGGRTGSEILLGQPNDNDNAANPIPGKGFDYCWTPTATNGTWLEYANTVFGLNNGTLPAGDYESFDPLTNLVGCPLNGEWKITVRDLWQSDNGYIFSWGIKFKDALYPAIETFQPALLTWDWKNHPTIFQKQQMRISASPKNAGTANYVFKVSDSFGCEWDTTLAVAVRPFTHPDCFKCLENFAALRDTSICTGNAVPLNAAYLGPNLQNITFENYLDYPLGFANHPPTMPFAAPVAVSSLGFATVANALNVIDKVCFDIDTDWDSDLDIWLEAPNGKRLELSTGNGGSGDHYRNTCFSPTATQSILGQFAPFTGTFRPEGNWAVLDGTPVDGNWKLVVSDDAGPNKMGKVNWWQIAFKAPFNIAYSWQNAASLSCSNCPNPTATPTTTTNYILQTTDNFNCTHRDTAQVQVFAAFAAPDGLTTASMANGSMTFVWQPVPGAAGYQVNVNNTGWVAANGNLAHTVGGLAPGNLVQIKVRVSGGSPNCPAQVADFQRVYVACNMVATVNSTLPAKCPGTATGSAFISVTAAVSPVKYFPDGGPTVFNNGGITNFFTAGDHFVIVEDATGCRDTVYFNITEPPAINLSATAVDASCNGDNDGSASASVAPGGGVAPFIFQWQRCTGGTVLTGPSINNLFAGCYNVTVTDGNNCTATTSVTVSEPPGFQFMSTQDSVNCYGGADGSATIFVTGGQSPYTYKWGNGSTNQTASGLNANFHAVTVTDFNGCQRTTIVQVLQPLALTIDSVPAKPATCFNSPDGTATVFVKGGTAPYQFLWEGGQTSATATGLSGGDIITVTVTDWHGCTDVSSTVIPEPLPIQVSANNIIAETCAGKCDGQVTISASGGNGQLFYVWSNPAIPPGSTNPTTLCAGTYTVTVADAKGCTGSVSATITGASAINIQISSKTDPKCAASTDGAVSISVAGGDAPYNYLWSNLSFSQNLSGVGCGTFTVTVTDEQGCIQTAQTQLICPPALQIQSITSTNVRCFGELNGSLAANATGGTAPLFYLWNDPNNQISATATNLAAGSYNLLVTDVNGCTTTSSGTVTQPQQLFSTVSTTDVKCFGESTGTATANPTGGTSPYTFKWNVPPTTPQITDLAAGSYNLTVTDANGCTFSPTAFQVNQPGAPVQVTATQTDTSCFGAMNSVVRATATGGTPAPGSVYTFDWPGNLTGQIQTGLPNGSYTVTATDGQGCTGSASVTVSEYAEILANLVTSEPKCFGTPDGQVSVNNVSGGAGNYTYNWSEPGAPNSPTVSELLGDKSYTVTIVDGRGCTSSFAVFLDQPAPITAQISVKPVSCNGLSDGEAIVSEVFGGSAVAGYLWSNTATENQILGVTAGTYFVTVTDVNGCTGSSSVQVPQPELLDISKFDVDPLKCAGDTVGAATPIVVGGTPNFSFAWSNGETTATISKLSAGTYAVTVTDANGCTTADSVDVNQPVPANLSLETDPIDCFGEASGRIRVAVEGGTGPYRFSLDGQNFSGSATFFGLKAGDYTVIVKDGFGCLFSIAGSLTDPAPLEVMLPLDTSITLGDSLILEPTVTGAVGILSYNWRSGYFEDLLCTDTLNCAGIQVKPLISNTYRVEVTDENGCTGEAKIRVEVEKNRGVYVPTGFTPNGDLENDFLPVFGKSRMVQQVLVFRVYDRWGELVFEDKNFAINDLAHGWDGNFRGSPAPAGEYAWYVEVVYLDGLKEIQRGSTMLIR